eukprot:UN08283
MPRVPLSQQTKQIEKTGPLSMKKFLCIVSNVEAVGKTKDFKKDRRRSVFFGRDEVIRTRDTMSPRNVPNPPSTNNKITPDLNMLLRGVTLKQIEEHEKVEFQKIKRKLALHQNGEIDPTRPS